MTAYADYSFYENKYLGGKAAVIPQEEFLYYARKAGNCLRRYTFGNIGENVPEAVRLCCCELAEAVFFAETSPAARGVSSERVGDIAVTYENGGDRRQGLPAAVKDIIYAWLGDTGLLYRGGRNADE